MRIFTSVISERNQTCGRLLFFIESRKEQFSRRFLFEYKSNKSMRRDTIFFPPFRGIELETNSKISLLIIIPSFSGEMYNSSLKNLNIYILQETFPLSLCLNVKQSQQMFFPSLALSLESREISKTSASEGGFLKKRSEWRGEEVDKWDSERVSNVWRRLKVK